MRRALIALPAVAVSAAAASLALGACGSATSGTAASAASSGLPHPGQSRAPRAGAGPGGMSDAVAAALTPLVEAGTITAAQQDAVAAAFEDGSGGGPPQAGPPPDGTAPQATQTPGAGQPRSQPGDMLATVLDPLVEDGTLTSAQASAVTRAIAETVPPSRAARAPPTTQGST